MLHLLFSKGGDLGFIGNRVGSAKSVTRLAALPICWFAMNFPASLSSVAWFVPIITPNPWFVIILALVSDGFAGICVGSH